MSTVTPFEASEGVTRANFNNRITEINTNFTELGTAKANASDLTAHTGNTDIHVTAAQKTAWTEHAANKENPHEVTAAQAGALPLAGGTMTGNLIARTNAAVGTAQVRNIYAGTTDLTAGTSTLATGVLYFVYE